MPTHQMPIKCHQMPIKCSILLAEFDVWPLQESEEVTPKLGPKVVRPTGESSPDAAGEL